MTKITTAREFLANAVRRNLAAMFPGHFDGAKHNHYADYGWPTSVTFQQLYAMYERNSVATAAVNKTARKVWETIPAVRHAEQGDDETPAEKEIRQRFDDLGVWRALAECHRRSMVGRYAGAILRIGDGKQLREPVDSVTGGLDALVEVIPAWEGQLTVAEWDTDEASPTYGKPLMFRFNETAIGESKIGRMASIHPDRVVIWSQDGTVNARSLLMAGYNDLIDMEKIKGAGGEGFWKNAKGAPVLEVDKEARLAEMAQAMGVQADALLEAMNDQVEDWQKGFDKLLMMQGMTAKTLPTVLPDPEPFFGVSLQSFAASVEIPVKVLVGMQTGERASQEDADEWARTCMGRRSDSVVPAIMEMINRLEAWGIIPAADWWLDWEDLTEAGMPERMDRAAKMAAINAQAYDYTEGGIVFTDDEIRDVVGMEPLADAGMAREDDTPPEDEESEI
ncbi:anti-CBASS protein Acb1 family protein [Sagittula sp. S175]|uniref:anti-CBASS protein Acb1 family protein n=1 Tax=Sagittula sp. S175 TaxID=3415129 RepID=UPI003C7ACFDE